MPHRIASSHSWFASTDVGYLNEVWLDVTGGSSVALTTHEEADDQYTIASGVVASGTTVVLRVRNRSDARYGYPVTAAGG